MQHTTHTNPRTDNGTYLDEDVERFCFEITETACQLTENAFRLLAKYINHVNNCEGFDYIEAHEPDNEFNLTKEEQETLKKIKELYK